ncbi:Uncharacterized protein Rs2_01177 [Raphanus sativus]|nr:Uncharacterized protein Rs2_01177 [Raphanus sativus]
MAPSSSSSPSKSPVPSLHPSLHFTPIPECEEDDFHEERYKNRATTPSSDGGSSATPNHHRHHNRRRSNENSYQHTLTPLHHNGNRKRQDHDNDEEYGGAVSCNKCRPHHSHRDKFSVVPLESHTNNTNNSNNTSFISSPNLIIKSIFQTLTRKSPKPSPLPPRSSSSSAADASREEQWRLAVAELSHKLIQATKKKEDAVVEASRLKPPCRSSRRSSTSSRSTATTSNPASTSAATRRNRATALSRALASQLRTVGGKVYERLSLLLQPFDVKINSFAKNPKSLIFTSRPSSAEPSSRTSRLPGFRKTGRPGS